jgi:hypothetical protein
MTVAFGCWCATAFAADTPATPGAKQTASVASPPSDRRLSAPHRVVRITPKDAKFPCEVSAAINPKRPDRLLASSFQTARTGMYDARNYTYNSTDGGATWKAIPAPNPGRRAQADDSVTFGPDGVAYHCYLSAVGYYPQDLKPRRAASGLFVRRSSDGLTWEPPVPVVDHLNTAEPMEDKPWITADGVAGSPHLGNVYVSWTRFDKYQSKDPEHRSRIFFARSTDGGRSFLPPMRISDKSGGVLDDANTVMGAVPAVGAKGEVYVVWSGPEGLAVDKSEDGGRSFGADVKIADQPGGWDFKATGLFRHNGVPSAGCDVSDGKFRGSVYVCWMDKRNRDADVFVSASRDGGKTWGRPVRVNDDAPRNDRDQLFAWMAIDPTDGAANVVFFDRRNNSGAGDAAMEVTLARSVDGCETFTNFAVNLRPFAPGAPFMGDYNGIAAFGGRVVAVFPHFVERRELAVSAALFRFEPGTCKVVDAGPAASGEKK